MQRIIPVNRRTAVFRALVVTIKNGAEFANSIMRAAIEPRCVETGNNEIERNLIATDRRSVAERGY